MNAPTILIDVSNLVFRAGFAFQHLSNDGVKTGALYGVLKTIYELRQKVSTRMLVVWDHGVPIPGAAKPHNWRDDVVKQYKATRQHGGEGREIIAQMPLIYKALCLLGYSSVSILGLEADDLIGILAQEIAGNVLIFSTDKDFYQLLNPRVNVLVPTQQKGEYHQIDMHTVLRDFGVPVNLWPQYLALGGDKSDNIKLPGMGPKTAARLIQAGVDLNKRPEQQPLAFWAKYGPVWYKIQQAYYAAHIPTRWEDPRITAYVEKAGGAPRYRIEQATGNKDGFIRLLAEHNMASLLSVRHGFFGTHTNHTNTNTNTNNGASQCKTNTNNTPPPIRHRQKPLV
jgi:5'-3' exonuclease